MRGLIGNGEIYGGRMESGLMGNSLVRNKPSQNVFEPVVYALRDPYWNNVVLYLKGDGADNSTDIVDSSPSPKIITRYGDTKISTTQSKYGGSSIYFDGSNDYLTTPASVDFTLDGDFTIEFFINISTIKICGIASNGFSSFISNAALILLNHSSAPNKISLFNKAQSENSIVASSEVSVNTWYHIAFVRSGNTVTSFTNGTVTQSATLNTIIDFSANGIFKLGEYWDGNFSGYIDSLRITKGIARYTANFNPETDTYLAY